MPKKPFVFDRLSRLVASAIGTLAPGYAVKYLHRRKMLASYKAARKDGPDKLWRPGNKSADAIIASDRSTLLARARDLERNSPHVSGAINKICNNVIYTGIFPQARIKDKSGKLRKLENARIEQKFNEWAEETGYYDKQELTLRHLWTDGELLIHSFLDTDLLLKGIVPLGLEIFEGDYLDQSVNGELANGNIAKSGIEYAPNGRAVAHYLFEEHPGEGAFTRLFGKVRRIPASEICHVFHQRRASQGRGITWLASLITDMRNFSEFQNNEQLACRLASAFGVFIESPYPEHQVNNPLFSGGQTEGTEVPALPTYIDPARIDVLPPGAKAQVAQYTRPGITYEPFTKVSLKGASAGTALSYENFTNDYEGATYSSARQAVLEERRGYRKMQTFLNRHFNRWVWNQWLTHARILGFLTDPSPVPVQWQNPGWPWIDPTKDAKGAQIELAMMLTTRRRLAAERGLDWDEEIDEYAEEEAIIREKKLKEPDNVKK